MYRSGDWIIYRNIWGTSTLRGLGALKPRERHSDHPTFHPPLILVGCRLHTMSSHPPGGDYDESLLDSAPKATRAEKQVCPFSRFLLVQSSPELMRVLDRLSTGRPISRKDTISTCCRVTPAKLRRTQDLQWSSSTGMSILRSDSPKPRRVTTRRVPLRGTVRKNGGSSYW